MSRQFGLGMMLTALSLTSTASWAHSNANGTITDLNIYAGVEAPGAFVAFSSTLGHPESCTYGPDNLIWIDFTSTIQPDGKALYAAVLAAYLAGRTISFGVHGCHTAADGSTLPVVYAVHIAPQ